MTTEVKLSTANFSGPLTSAPCGLNNTVGSEGQRSFHQVKEGVTFEEALAATKTASERTAVRTPENDR